MQISKDDFRQINQWLWEIPKEFRKKMKVPARVYTSSQMLENILEDDSIEQLVNGASLPGITEYAIAMPDAHQGYSVPIGFVGATELPEGVISPGAVGFDISCGMRVLKSNLSEEEIKPYLAELSKQIKNEVPSGLGKGREKELSINEIDNILDKGAAHLVSQGYGEKSDLENCEENGAMKNADSSLVSKKAKERGRDQVGTLGSGNHFCEIQKVANIFDEETAKAFGLFKDQVIVMVHCGSRALGHQVCTDYLDKMKSSMEKYGIKMSDKSFAAVPFNSKEGQEYFHAMASASNYAWANRQRIAFGVRKAWKRILGEKENLNMLYDVSHNIAKVEYHQIKKEEKKVLVHRKGATRAFPPEHKEIPDKYKKVGQPVLIPGSMGSSSYILVGTNKGKESFYSTSHGAGRRMSRRQATKKASGREVVKELAQEGVIVESSSKRGVAEEAPIAYKDINQVVEVVHQAGLSDKVAELTPLVVLKGE